MRFAVLIAVLSLSSVMAQAEEAVTPPTTSCAQANSDMERHDLGCRDEDMYIVMPDNEPND